MAGKGKKNKEFKKVQKAGKEVRAANKPEYVTGTGQELWRVHLKQDCMHRICDIHNPPQGLPESDWPTHWRADRGLMERICPHGVGHPTAAHMLFLKEMDAVRGTTNAKWEGIHGCDGCCGGNYNVGKDRREPFSKHPCGVCPLSMDFCRCPEEDEPYGVDEEVLPNNGASDWEMGRDWSRLLTALFDNPVPVRPRQSDFFSDFFSPAEMPEAHMCPPDRCPQPEWVDHDAPPNGIGPVCRHCGLLIDSDPQDHALDCDRFGNSDGLG